jgi:protein associated with RNAse G/E
MINVPDSLIVKALKYDGSLHRSWSGSPRRQAGSQIIIEAAFDFEVQHELLGVISRGTRTIEYYWLDRWYNIFQFLETDGSTRLYYCNVNTPPTIQGNVLTYIDLDIDILVQPDFSYQVLDLEEFATNASRYDYSAATKRQAHNALDELISLIEGRQDPFSLNYFK